MSLEPSLIHYLLHHHLIRVKASIHQKNRKKRKKSKSLTVSLFAQVFFSVSGSPMDMFMNQGDKKIKNPPRFQFQTLFRYLISRNRPVLALKAAFVFFVVVLWCLRMVDFSGFSISFSSFNLGRTHMFLLCNGIVLILVKGSVLSTPREGVVANHHMKQEMMNVEKVVLEFEVIKENDHVNSDEIVLGIEEEEEDEKTSNGCVLIAETQPVDQQLVEEEDGMREAEELSVEELNKKCDDFIKKMRQVLCNRH